MTCVMSRAPILALAALTALAATPAPAAAPKLEAKRAAALESLTTCRKETVDAQRLACFDKAVGALDEAEAKGQVVVIDREQVREVKRQAFGFSLPALSFFSARGGGGSEEKIDRVTYTLDHAGRTAAGLWTLTTTDGPVWVQTDSSDELRADPHKGSTLTVRHAALSSFFCNVDGQRAIRCNRQR